MSLRKKTIFAMGTLLVLLMVLLFAVIRYSIFNAFDILQKQDIRKDMGRATNALNADISSLSDLCQGIASLDGAARFIRDGNLAGINDQVSNLALRDKKINFAYITNAQGEIVFSAAVDLGSGRAMAFPPSLSALNRSGQIKISSATGQSGMIILPESPALYSQWPVRSAVSGEALGSLAIGRYLDSNYIHNLATSINLYHLNLYEISVAANESDISQAIARLESGELTPTKYSNSAFIAAYTYLKDMNNNAILILKVDKPDDIFQAGQSSAEKQLIFLLVAGIIFIVMLLIILDKMVLSRLFRLKAEVGNLTLDGTRFQRVSSQGNDEFSSLSRTINQMIERTESSQMAVKESERRFRELAELLPISIFETDVQGGITFINNNASKAFEVKREELIGLNIFDFISMDRTNCLAGAHVIAAGESIRGTEYCAARANGATFPVLTYLAAIQDENGTLSGLRGTFVDITERKRMEQILQENEQKYRLLVENQSDLVVEIDTRGKFLFVNPAYCKLAGKTKEALIGTSFITQIQADDREKVLQDLESLKQPPHSVYSECRMMMNNGWRWLAWTHNAVLDRNGRITSLTCTARDVTESKRAKDDLERANKQLKELDKMKDNFLSTVSHELRTPLTSIKSFTEILLMYEEERATQIEFLSIINEESDRLTRLINDFLDLSKIQSGKMQWKTAEIPLSEVINLSTGSARPLIQKANLELILNIESRLPPVVGDKDKLLQVFTNLLGNAIKFTPEGGKLTVQARSNPPDNPQWVIVSITDTGIGIAPENHQKIFENFGQVGDVLKDRPKGTGLGLPISKKIVEYYGGKLWVESALGKGTTFFFSLPTAKVKAASNAEGDKLPGIKNDLPPAINGKTILVVDDEANIRRFISHQLTRLGHQVLEASRGFEAVELSKKHHPDLITLDIMMPELNGFDVTAALKKDPGTQNIPILIISVIEDQQKAYDLGVNDYITKPISIDILVQRVNLLLGANQKNILFVEDNLELTRSLEEALRKRGFTLQTAGNAQQALRILEQNRPELIILDLNVPEKERKEIIEGIKDIPETAKIPIIVLTDIKIDGERVRAFSSSLSDAVDNTQRFDWLFQVIESTINKKVKKGANAK